MRLYGTSQPAHMLTRKTCARGGFEYLGTDPVVDKFTAGPPPKTPPSYTPSTFFGTGTETGNCTLRSPMITIFDSLDYVIAQRAIPMEDYEEEFDYVSKTNLYEKACQFPDSIPAESAIDSFYTANESSSIGLFHELERHSMNSFSNDSASTQIIRYNDSLIVAGLKQIAFNDSLLFSGILVSDSLNLLEDNRKLRNNILSLMRQYEELFQDLDTLHSQISDSLLDENDAISASLTMESNRKDIMGVYYQTFTKGIFTFDSAQTSLIYSIATQCPFTGGKPVIMAQILYKYINDTVVFNGDTLCEGSESRLGYEADHPVSSSVYPNPAGDRATLRYQLNREITGWFIVYNPLGEEKLRIRLTAKSSSKQFSCSALSPGIYMYRVLENDHSSSSGKFCIAR